MTEKRFATQDIALIGIFSALWVVLNYYVAPLSFQLLHLPVGHGILVFFTLLLVAWATGKFGAASAVGIIGSTIVMLAGGPPPVLSFAATSLLFDVVLTVSHHKLEIKPFNVGVAVLGIAVSAYTAGILTGFFILGQPFEVAATVWGGWTLLGGVLGAAVTLPLIGVLEKTGVKGLKTV
jgi:hypothetical protein